MKKQNMNVEAQTTENTTPLTETTNTEKKATKATAKKEEKKMTSTKKSETATTVKTEVLEFLKAYRMNEAGEFLMTAEMFDEFKAENASLVFGSRKTDKDVRLVKMSRTDKQAVATIRIDETAKKKQVHVHTGATKKVVSARDEKSGIRYKVILRDKTQKFELWSADGAGKRKMVKRGTEEEVMAEYNKVLGIEATPEVKKVTRKTAKKSA